MKYKITLNHAQVTLKVNIKTSSPETVLLRVSDAKNPMRVFTNRYMTINGEKSLYVRMPLSPEIAIVEVRAKDASKKNDVIKFESVEKEALQKRIDVNDIGNVKIRSFVDFAQRFCYNMDELEPDIYTSNDRNFYIDLKERITDKNGNEVNTPARVSRKSGIIQVSKKAFLKMTVPMRFAILLHEFSHFYLNQQIDDEIEADLNGLLIYLSLGYPRIEAYDAFLDTFKGVPSELNKKRYDVLNNFITNFENLNLVIAGN